MKITRIEAQVKQKGRYSIYADDKFVFGISELGLINAGYRIGQELTPDQLAQAKEDAQSDKIYNQLLGLIARRPRSEWEIRDYLHRKDVDSVQTDDLVARLEGRGFIDDHDFAERWVSSRRLLKPTSRRKLELELRTKRVPDSIIRDVLSNDEVSEYDVLLQEVEKKRRQTRYQDNDKLMQYLIRQGYGYEDVKRALTDNG